jgi:hypothetical protein
MHPKNWVAHNTVYPAICDPMLQIRVCLMLYATEGRGSLMHADTQAIRRCVCLGKGVGV